MEGINDPERSVPWPVGEQQQHPNPIPEARERAVMRHIPYFVGLANAGNYARAADWLGISQSALSRRIQTLEQELGIALFEKAGRTAKLTGAGESFREDAEKYLRDMGSAIRRAQLVSNGRVGKIDIAASGDAIRSKVIVNSIGKFSRSFPNVRIKLQSVPAEAQLLALQQGDIDIGIFFDIVIDEPSRPMLELLSISKSRTLLALNRHHVLAAREQIFLADLQDQWLAWPSHKFGRSMSNALSAKFRLAGVSPTIAIEVQTDETTLDLAAANLGLGFIQENHWLPEDVVVRPVEDLDITLSLSAVWRRDNVSTALRNFVEILQSRLRRENENH